MSARTLTSIVIFIAVPTVIGKNLKSSQTWKWNRRIQRCQAGKHSEAFQIEYTKIVTDSYNCFKPSKILLPSLLMFIMDETTGSESKMMDKNKHEKLCYS